VNRRKSYWYGESTSTRGRALEDGKGIFKREGGKTKINGFLPSGRKVIGKKRKH